MSDIQHVSTEQPLPGDLSKQYRNFGRFLELNGSFSTFLPLDLKTLK